MVDVYNRGIIGHAQKPKIIQRHLSTNSDFEREILESDRVCLICYKFHLLILKDHQPVRTDEDLKKIIDILNKQSISLTSPEDISSAAMTKTLVKVGNVLLANSAVLLPTIQSEYNAYVELLFQATGISKPHDLNPNGISSRQILSELVAKYQHHIAYACKVRKYGTVVFRPGCDFLELLSEVMWLA